ncbi:50S ribosomal protein L19 [Candidatus Roizmanbacteria bacterium CG09_land_8_20_14_0_10_41_9]|uniref:50S ribosomal protein L19 n=1 Tax=Candidatus Roizmanbacteria bacterium CG09_land_8_20_14_0_10_41_9 TaxID=1974850 RepID=A0A2H0WUS0_9BACT|nr:MAG: 50S ribosomal protein L19 [Candidatus Roizmanbacteria bacterium CG09_land_8_20_14_0_10_41_9]
MANSFEYQKQHYAVGDTISISYKIREGDKERQQLFKGIVIKIRGNTPETKMLTVRKVSKSGIGVERIIPLNSPFIAKMHLDRKGKYTKSKLYFIRGLTEAELRNKLYKEK